MSKKTPRDRAARERIRRDAARAAHKASAAPAPAPEGASTRRAAAQACGWCGATLAVKATGRIPKWCSASCRQRAWEQSRAAASGRCAVEVVERVVTVAAEKPSHRRRDDWPALLRDLATQLDRGLIYPRDLLAILDAAHALVAALNRRR